MKMKPFDSVDWSCFAGADGDAQIGSTDLKVTGLKKGDLTAVVIADEKGIQIVLEENEGFFNKPLTLEQAITVAEFLPDSIPATVLLSLGFEFCGPDQEEK